MPSITYDKNGNITTLQRNGKVGAGFALMDNLTYSYAGNRLQRVEDAISGDNTVDFVNRNAGTEDYDYYTDGSLKKDLNKEITQIDYDAFLKLPKLITLTNNRWIKITYAANGQVLKRTYSTGEFWEYDGDLVYKNGLPYQLSTPEGRATYTSNVWNYEYVIKDHLGNTRISFKANGTNPQLIDNIDFDPFGIELNGTGVNNPVENRFKYQNKETLALFGLNGINDFGARFFDKTIGRWWGGDPLSEISRRFSPYVYSNDNPLRFIDPDGMAAVGADGLTNEQWLAARGNTEQENEFRNENRGDDRNKKKDKEKQRQENKPLQATLNPTAPIGVGQIIRGLGSLVGDATMSALGLFALAFTMEGDTPSAGDNPPLRIALGVDALLKDFSTQVGAIPYYDGWAKASDEKSAIIATIIALGQKPETTFHFNLSTGVKGTKVNDAINLNVVFSDSHTTAEFLTVTRLFPEKTYFYIKSGSIYKPVKLNFK